MHNQTSDMAPKGGLNRRVPALDGLRGLAILAVFAYHYGNGGNQSSIVAVRAVSKVLGVGWSGVDLFFVLSGFLITGILLDTSQDSEYYKKFYVRRVLRIFPIYYLAAGIVCGLGVAYGVHWKAGHLFFLIYCGYPAAVMWPALVQLSPLIRITHLWSLSVEEQFYMVWPWAIRRLASKRNIMYLCLAMFVAAIACRIAFVVLVNPVWAYVFLPCRMDTLAVGAAISVALRGSGAEKVRGWASPTLLCTMVSFVMICAVRRTVDHNDAAIATVGYSLSALACGALLVLSLGPLSKALSWSPLQVFGRYSYGLYLYHFPLSALLEPLKPWLIRQSHLTALGSIAYVISCLAINLLVAAVSFHYIESPILKLKARYRYDREVNLNAAERAPSVSRTNGVSSDVGARKQAIGDHAAV